MDRRFFLLSFVAGVGLSGCASEPPLSGPMAQIGFSNLPALWFKAVRIDVRSTYKMSLDPPHAEYRMPTSPERALRDWALRRLQAAGGEGDVSLGEFMIEDASVIKTRLKKSGGLKGLLTYEPTVRYVARAAARFTLKNPVSGARGSARAAARRSIEIRENATLAQREQAWLGLVEDLMADFNARMEKEIRTYLAPWLEPTG